MATGSGLYTVLGCAFLLSSILIRAALALRPSALRAASGGATVPIEALVGFGSSTFSTGQGSSYVH